MDSYILGYETIDGNPALGVTGHVVQSVKIFDRDIDKILPYGDHDVLVGTMEPEEEPRVYCLKTYKGISYQRKHMVQRLREMGPDEAEDFSKSTERRISTDSIIKARNILGSIEERGRVERLSTRCAPCMKLESILEQERRQSQKPL